MEYNYNYNEFLLDLDKSNNKTIYARITALTFDERPIETIEGKVTGGSINIDGASSLRRTCSITMVALDQYHNNFYMGLNTKFKLEIGVENNIDASKPKIIWFKQGIYIITSFNTSHSTNNFTISLSGKDKMVLLNGEVGGSLFASVDFGTIEEEINGNWIIRKIPIYDIIKNAVHVYAGEPFHNIIINDLDTCGIELLEYRYDTPMYLYRKYKEDTVESVYSNVMLENNVKQWYFDSDEDIAQPASLKDIPNSHLDMLVDPLTGSVDASPVYLDSERVNKCLMAKIEYGQTAGYRTTDLVYAGDLIGNIGESLTSILDKIRNMLTEFEYFYNVDGQFVFQKKKSFIQTMWTSTGNDQYMSEATAFASNYIYKFFNNMLITAFNNNPNLLNLRNDFSIWGERESVSGAKIPIHLRYVIDEKPVRYTTIKVDDDDLKEYNEKYGTSLKGQNSKMYDIENWDWREIIYQMAIDYFKYNHLDDFELRLIQANPDIYPSGRTGYENYYTDIQGFWRQLYNPELDKQIEAVEASIDDISGKIDEETNSVEKKKLEQEKKNLEQKKKDLEDERENYFYDVDKNDDKKKFWHKNVYAQPYLLNFWFDFLDTSYDFEMAKYSVKAIGSRPKSINDTNIKAIYFRDTPDIIFVKKLSKEDQLPGFRYIQIGDYEGMFSISAQGKSAKDKLDELLYQHSYCIESINITSIPVYYLEPNTRIYVEDKKTNLQGDYIISKITIPLTYNGTMSITATKAAENII